MAEGAERLRRAEEEGHEPRDVNIRGVLWVAVLLAASIALSAAVVGGLVWLFDLAMERPAVSPLERAEMVPPPPRLDARPAQTLVEIRQREDGLLGSFEWLDRQAGIARIPIGDAMDIVAERGWPEEGQGAGPAVLEGQQQQ